MAKTLNEKLQAALFAAWHTGAECSHLSYTERDRELSELAIEVVGEAPATDGNGVAEAATIGQLIAGLAGFDGDSPVDSVAPDPMSGFPCPKAGVEIHLLRGGGISVGG